MPVKTQLCLAFAQAQTRLAHSRQRSFGSPEAVFATDRQALTAAPCELPDP